MHTKRNEVIEFIRNNKEEFKKVINSKNEYKWAIFMLNSKMPLRLIADFDAALKQGVEHEEWMGDGFVCNEIIKSDGKIHNKDRELSESQKTDIIFIKEFGEKFHHYIDVLHGDKRSLALAKTKFEECMMWAVKGVSGG